MNADRSGLSRAAGQESRRPLDLLWLLPSGGDGRHLGSTVGQGPAGNRCLREIAQAAGRLGYRGVLLPTGTGCEDAWITGTSIATPTERPRSPR